VDIERSIKMALETGKVLYGQNQAERACKEGKAKLVIKARNAPGNPDLGSVEVKAFEGSGMELGSVCGKPFSVAYLTVLEPGRSDILRI